MRLFDSFMWDGGRQLSGVAALWGFSWWHKGGALQSFFFFFLLRFLSLFLPALLPPPCFSVCSESGSTEEDATYEMRKERISRVSLPILKPTKGNKEIKKKSPEIHTVHPIDVGRICAPGKDRPPGCTTLNTLPKPLWLA